MIVLAQIGLVHDIPYTGSREVDVVGAALSVVGMGGVVLGILLWQEGGECVGLTIAGGAVGLYALSRWLVRRHREGKATVLDPDLFRLPHFRLGISGQTLQQITLGGAMIALPIFLQITAGVRRAGGRPVARAAVADDVRPRDARRQARGEPPPGEHHPGRLRPRLRGTGRAPADHPARRIGLGADGPADRRRRGPRPAGLAAQQLHARPDRGGARQRGRRRELRGRVVRALVRPRDGRRHPARDALARVHQQDRREPGDPRGAAGADRRHARARCSGREQHRACASARRRAAGRAGRGPSDQPRLDGPRAADRAARADPRQPARLPDLVPDAAAPGHRAVGLAGRRRAGLNARRGSSGPERR